MNRSGPAKETVASWARHLGRPVPDPDELRARLGAGSLAQEFARRAAAAPERPALTLGGETVSHGDLDRAAAAVGGWLREQGVVAGDRVLIVGASSRRLVEAYLGTLRCGATALFADSGITDSEQARLVNATRPALAFLGAPRSRPPAGVADRVVMLDDDEDFGEATAGSPIAPAPARAPALLAHTSGTTGQPKGVPLSHRNVLASIRAAMCAWRWSADDVLAHALPLSHQHGLGGLHATLLAGSHAVIEPSFDAVRFGAAAGAGKATVIMAVPAIYERLCEWEGIAAAGLDRVRLAISGSAPLPPGLAHRCEAWLGQLPLERYGSTEAGLVLSNRYDGPRLPGRVGWPLPGIEIEVRDPDGRSVAVGEEGELVVRGPQVFAGYADDPDATSEAFTADGWFRSGDIVQVDPEDGSVAITGRAKEMIISGGLNVYPREVELALDDHPGVRRSAVVGVPSERWGEEVVAFVVPRGSVGVDVEAVRSHCRRHLSNFKCPKRILPLDELPADAMGKVRREELIAIARMDG